MDIICLSSLKNQGVFILDKWIIGCPPFSLSGFLNELPTRGMAGVMGRVTLDAGQAAYFVEHRVDNPGVETTVAVGVGGRR